MSSIETIICKKNIKNNYNNYKLLIPITTTKEIMEELYNNYKIINKPKELINNPTLSKIKDLFPNMQVINLSKVELEINNKTHYGINLHAVNIPQILIDYKKTKEDEFYINFLNNKGEPDNKCFITNKIIPHHLFYSNKIILL